MTNTQKVLNAKVDTIVGHANVLAADQFLIPLDIVQILRMIRETADSALDNAVSLAAADGATWEQIGRMLDTSRQAAWERYR